VTHDATRDLESLVRRLPRAIDPPPELWTWIAAHLDTPLPRALEERVRDLPTNIAPPPELWPRIAARLRAEAPRESRTRLAAAAAAAAVTVAAIAMLATLAVLRHDPAGGAGDMTARATREGDADTGASTALGAAWMLRSPAVSSDVAATLQRELTLVRDERLRIEAAIDREPDNVELRELWAHTYQVELELADTCGRTIMTYERG